MSADTPEELTSWKEIAQRLQVTVRTAQEWEKTRGLPVRRIPGGGRSRVFMRVSELEAWLDGQFEEPSGDRAGESRAESDPGVRLGHAPALVVIAMLVITAVGGAAYLYLRPLVDPVDFRILPDEVVIFDEAGEELWRNRFDVELDEPAYENKSHNVGFDDVDGDGAKEVLFAWRPKDRARSDALICFDDRGAELWRFTPGADVASGYETFTNNYNVAEFRLFDLPDGSRAVVVVGAHHIEYPTQVTVLAAVDGSVISQYWHSGHVGTEPEQLAVADADVDGVPELYLVGISNAYRRATLVVLDPLEMYGASAEDNSNYQLQGFDPSREIARILFRRSAINRAREEWNLASNIWATAELITVSVNEGFRDPAGPGVTYYLAPDLMFDHMSFNSSFPMVHARMLQEGLIGIDLEEQRSLLSGVDHLIEPLPLVGADAGGR